MSENISILDRGASGVPHHRDEGSADPGAPTYPEPSELEMVLTMIERAEQAGIDPERILRALTLTPATVEALQQRARAKP